MSLHFLLTNINIFSLPINSNQQSNPNNQTSNQLPRFEKNSKNRDKKDLRNEKDDRGLANLALTPAKSHSNLVHNNFNNSNSSTPNQKIKNGKSSGGSSNNNNTIGSNILNINSNNYNTSISDTSRSRENNQFQRNSCEIHGELSSALRVKTNKVKLSNNKTLAVTNNLSSSHQISQQDQQRSHNSITNYIENNKKKNIVSREGSPYKPQNNRSAILTQGEDGGSLRQISHGSDNVVESTNLAASQVIGFG